MLGQVLLFSYRKRQHLVLIVTDEVAFVHQFANRPKSKRDYMERLFEII